MISSLQASATYSDSGSTLYSPLETTLIKYDGQMTETEAERLLGTYPEIMSIDLEDQTLELACWAGVAIVVSIVLFVANIIHREIISKRKCTEEEKDDA